MLRYYDLHPNNIIMSATGPVIIDWMGTMKGDPMADVARTWFLCTYPPSTWPVRFITVKWSRYFFRIYLKHYNSLTDFNEERFNLWKIPILAARLREEKTDARKKYLLGVLENMLESQS